MLRAQLNVVEVMDSWTVTVSLWDYSDDGGMDPIAGRSDTLLATDYEQLQDPLGALWSVLHRVLTSWDSTSQM
jgi:hypothetical protein